MKKSLIAASASAVALAAMPIVGVFADATTQVDTLEVTISKVCSFGFQDTETPHIINVPTPSHTDGTGGSGPATWDNNNKLSAVMLNGTENKDFGKTTLSVYCNNKNGYNITTNGTTESTLTVGPLAAQTSGNTDNIPVANDFGVDKTGWSYKVVAGSATTQRGTVPAAHNDTWATEANAAGVIAINNSTTANAGDSYTITYGVGIDQNLSADTYSGSITYTLVQL